VRVAGLWRYVYRAVDQHGQVIDVNVSKRRNLVAAARFFEIMLSGRDRPKEVTTDLAAPLLRVVDKLLPDALHDTTQHANNRIECDHGRLKSRPRPMRCLRTDRTATVVISGHAFIQNVRRGHYELFEVVALGHVADHSHTDETSEAHFAPQPDLSSFAVHSRRTESGGHWLRIPDVNPAGIPVCELHVIEHSSCPESADQERVRARVGAGDMR
ncbi:MAG: hypothetical protein ACI89G_003187, partial [Minisyncoccia bacterium]